MPRKEHWEGETPPQAGVQAFTEKSWLQPPDEEEVCWVPQVRTEPELSKKKERPLQSLCKPRMAGRQAGRRADCHGVRNHSGATYCKAWGLSICAGKVLRNNFPG